MSEKELLCRGWEEEQVVTAVQQATPLARSVLRSMAQHPGTTADEIAQDIGAKGMTAVAGCLSSWYQNVTRPLGVKDPDTGEDSWPFTIEAPTDERRSKAYRYFMPPQVAEIILRHTDSDM